MIDGTASVFIAVDNTKVSKTTAIMTSIFQCWPIFVVTFLMTVLAGILIWMAVNIHFKHSLAICHSL